MISRRAVLLTLMILTASLLSCRKAEIHNIPESTIPASSERTLKIEEVEKAILLAGKDAGWSMLNKEPGLIVATIQVRQHEASVNIRYTTKTWSITYRDSTNLKSDGVTIHKNYNKWVNQLAAAVRRELSEIPNAPRQQ